MRICLGMNMYRVGVGFICIALSGCAGSFLHATRSVAGSEGLVDVAPPSSTPASGRAQANSPVKLAPPAQKIKPPTPPLAARTTPSPNRSNDSAPARATSRDAVDASRISRDAVDPPALVDGRLVNRPAESDSGFLLPAKLKRSTASASVVAAKPSNPTSLPADVASLLTTDAIDRKMAALDSNQTPPSTPPSPAGIKIPRAVTLANTSPRPLAASGGIALTGPSEIDSAELVEALLASREAMNEVKQVSHEVAEPPAPAAIPEKPRPVAIKDVPPLVESKPALEEAKPAADSFPSPAAIGSSPRVPAADSQLVAAVADDEILNKTSVVPVASHAEPVPVPEISSAAAPSKKEFAVERFHFCSEINGFGSTVSRPAGPMVPGERLLAYVEVMNFESAVKDGMFETNLSCRMRLEDATGQMVFSQEFGDIVDRCVGRRQDFFCHFLLTVPDTLPPGKYRWKISLTDNASKKTSESTLETEIGSGEPGERNDLQ